MQTGLSDTGPEAADRGAGGERRGDRRSSTARAGGGIVLPPGSAWGEVDSPVGPLALVVTPAGLQRLAFGPLASIRGEYAAARDGAQPEPGPLAGHPIGRAAIRQLAEYFAGARRDFDLPVDWSLTAGAQRAILDTLYREVRFGATVGYGELARLAGRTTGAARLVGTVMGSNPVAIVVPCHRVVAADGGIGGFGGGLAAKRLLLGLEGALPPPLFDI